MLLPEDLDVYVLVVVFVQGGCGCRTSEPEIDCVGGLVQRDAGEGDAGRDVCKQGLVFVAQVVVLGLCVADQSPFIVSVGQALGADGVQHVPKVLRFLARLDEHAASCR